MRSGKENMVVELAHALSTIGCYLFVVTVGEGREPTFLFVFPDKVTPEDAEAVNKLQQGGAVPDRVMAIVDFQDEAAVRVMVSERVDRDLGEKIMEMFETTLRNNALVVIESKTEIKTDSLN